MRELIALAAAVALVAAVLWLRRGHDLYDASRCHWDDMQ